jgi:predicted small lipoprotein YifL
VILIVKSSLALSIALPLLAVGVLSLSGCGQPGPLYMPKMPPRPGSAPANATTPAPGAVIQGAPPDTLPGATPDLTLPAPSPTTPVLPK